MTRDARAPGESPRACTEPGRRRGLLPDDREIAGPLAWVTPWALAAVAVLVTLALGGCAGAAEATSITRPARNPAAESLATALQVDAERATQGREWPRRGEPPPHETARRYAFGPA